jgi:hypothetical protein
MIHQMQHSYEDRGGDRWKAIERYNMLAARLARRLERMRQALGFATIALPLEKDLEELTEIVADMTADKVRDEF